VRLHVVCPSVCLSVSLSVTFRYRDHIGWNSSKIISRPNSLRPLLWMTTTWAIWCNGNTPKLGLNMVGQEHKKLAKCPKRCTIGQRILLRTNRKSHKRFQLAPTSMTLDDLERPKRPSCRNKQKWKFRSPPEKISTKIDIVGSQM